MKEVVVLSYVRTPFGGFGGALKDIKAHQLGAIVLSEVVKRGNITPAEVDYVIMGQAIQSGSGPVPCRQAMEVANFPSNVNFLNIANACSSAMRALSIAKLLIENNEADVVIVGGQESMSSSPYLLQKARWGYRLGQDVLLDALHFDGLIWPKYNAHMGTLAGWVAKEYNITREEQDRWALRSHELAVQAQLEGKFKEEIVAVEVPQKKGAPILFEVDEGPRKDTSYDKISKLPPVFEKDGTITAGNAPPLSDGAAAVLISSYDFAQRKGIKPLARILSCGSAADDAKYISRTPAYAIAKALKNANLSVSEMNLIEINEAFAVVPLISGKILEIMDWEKVNVNGGAVAIGHPVSASGIRILGTLILELRRRGLKLGAAGICGAGASGDAVVVEVL